VEPSALYRQEQLDPHGHFDVSLLHRACASALQNPYKTSVRSGRIGCSREVQTIKALFIPGLRDTQSHGLEGSRRWREGS
jgi:hypothetical protein